MVLALGKRGPFQLRQPPRARDRKAIAWFDGRFHKVANVVGAQPAIRIYETPDNVGQVRAMFALRHRLWWTLIGIAFLTALLGLRLLLGPSWSLRV